jgi:hypothetical protein
VQLGKRGAIMTALHKKYKHSEMKLSKVYYSIKKWNGQKCYLK